MDSVSRRLDHEPWRGEGEIAHWIAILTCLKWKQRGEVTSGRSHSDPRASDIKASFRQHYSQQLTNVAPAEWKLFALLGNSPEKLPLCKPHLRSPYFFRYEKNKACEEEELESQYGGSISALWRARVGLWICLSPNMPLFSSQRWPKQPSLLPSATPAPNSLPLSHSFRSFFRYKPPPQAFTQQSCKTTKNK